MSPTTKPNSSNDKSNTTSQQAADPSSRRQRLRVEQEKAAREARVRKIITFSGLGVVLVAVISLVAWGIVSGVGKAKQAENGVNATYAAVLGQDTAPVTLDVFQDFMCPVCGEFEKANGADVGNLIAAGTVKLRIHPMNFLDDSSRHHFDAVLSALAACGVPYTVNPRLVRGLDYYTRTTFEFTVPSSGDPASGLGTQNALLGGGRYDGLSEMLGGPRAPGIGFAIGEDRLILTLQAQAGAPHLASEMWEKKLDAYIAPLGSKRNAAALALARELRRAGLSVEVGDGAFRLKKSFEAADRVARHIVILGEDELASGILTVKTFATGEQTKIAQADLAQALRA